jgi:hypothetical protein
LASVSVYRPNAAMAPASGRRRTEHWHLARGRGYVSRTLMGILMTTRRIGHG